MISQGSIRSVMMSGLLAISQLAMATTSDPATLTAGLSSSSCGGLAHNTFTGFGSGLMGSYSPTALSGGEAVVAVYDIQTIGCGNPYRSYVTISGFSADPGKNWLISITCNGVELTGGGSAAYGYGAGHAAWNWTTPFAFHNGSVYSCTIVHN